MGPIEFTDARRSIYLILVECECVQEPTAEVVGHDLIHVAADDVGGEGHEAPHLFLG